MYIFSHPDTWLLFTGWGNLRGNREKGAPGAKYRQLKTMKPITTPQAAGMAPGSLFAEINRMVKKSGRLTASQAKKTEYGESGKYVDFADRSGKPGMG